jgi:hypothetical protein
VDIPVRISILEIGICLSLLPKPVKITGKLMYNERFMVQVMGRPRRKD